MTLIPLDIPAGFYRNGTDLEQAGRWRDGSLVRWRDNSLRPIGGWRERKTSFCTNPVRGMHTWETINGNAWLAGGSHDALTVMTGAGIATNITPTDLAVGREDAANNTGFGGGFYGVGYFGQPIQSTSVTVPQEASTWALDNWGEYLVACHYDDGRLLEWQLETTTGSELVTNGAFASDASWTKGTGWTIASGVASFVPTGITIDASSSTNVGLTLDLIKYTSHGFSNGDLVLYTVSSGETAIGGLTDGTVYEVAYSGVDDANQFQLKVPNAGLGAIDLTSLGTGTSDTFKAVASKLEQTVTGLTDEYRYTVNVSLIDPDNDSDASTIPSGTCRIVKTGTSTVLATQTLSVGSNTFSFVADGTSVDIEIYGATPYGIDFNIDDVSLKQNASAAVISNAPTSNLGLIVTEERFIFALGAGGNPRKVQWCDFEDNTVWTPSTTNQAGSQELQTSGQIMIGIRTRGQTLIITDTDAHAARYAGPPYIYNFQRVGTSCGAISRKAASDVDMGVFWMGQRGFFRFDGNSVSEIPCDVHDYVFGDFNVTQQSKVWSISNGQYGEVWWFYCSSNSTEIDRYVAFDYKENHWLIGDIARTSGVERGVFRYPFMAGHNADSDIYDHEVGVNFDGATTFAETGPMSIGAGDNIMKITKLIPDEKTQGDVSVTFKTRFYPNEVDATHGPFTPSNPTSVRFSGRQFRMRVEGERLENWRVGTMRVDAVAGGKR